MTEPTDIAALFDAVDRYFDLMYDYNVSHFGEVFADSAQLHGLTDEGLKLISANEFKSGLASNPSPESKNAQRFQEIVLLDIASRDQALAKVRVRIDTLQYIDYLSYHLIDNKWLITAKSFHIERRFST